MLSPIPVKDCLEMGINTYYTTPLNLQELSNAIVPALESHQLQPGDSVKDVILNILLAEDNLVNQKLAVKLLEVAGHKIEVANNGEIALEQYKWVLGMLNDQDGVLIISGNSGEDVLLEHHLISFWWVLHTRARKKCLRDV